MDKKEIMKLLSYMNTYYSDRFKFPREKKTKTKMVIETWHEFLQDYDYELVKVATKKLMTAKEWPPTPGEVIQEINKLTAEDNTTWEEAYHKTMQLIKDYGVQYGRGKIKENLTDKEIKAAEMMGGFVYMGHKITDRNRDFAMNRYKEIWEKLTQREEEFEKLPPSQRKDIERLAGKFKGTRRTQIEGEVD